MKTYLDIPTILRTINRPMPTWMRLNVTVGLSVWRPRFPIYFIETP